MRSQSTLRRFSNFCSRDGVILSVAACIATVLLIAAIGKFLYPLESMENFERVVSILEFFLLGAVLYFRRHWQLWLLCAAVFSAWGGYALFWYLLELPCSCMGSMVHIPTIFSIIADLAFFSASLILARATGAKRDFLYLSILLGFYFALAGFAFGEGIYHHYLWSSS